MAHKQKLCKRGHDMDVYRKQHPNGDTYCSLCKKIRYDNFRKNNPEKAKLYCQNSNRRRFYNLEPSEYKALLDLCDNKCMICGNNHKDKTLHIDHCHNTRIVRGLLCHHCNTAIGLFNENVDIMLQAIKYLNESKKRKKA